MGWLGNKQEETPQVIHTGARRDCWAKRDAFFACLDKHDIIDSIKDDAGAWKACSPEIKAFESACISSWVDYFKQKRVADIARQRRVQELEAQGYKPLDVPLSASDVRPRS